MNEKELLIELYEDHEFNKRLNDESLYMDSDKELIIEYESEDAKRRRNSMLEHQKKVINNLLHDNSLLQKELNKSRKWLTNTEYKHLLTWVDSLNARKEKVL